MTQKYAGKQRLGRGFTLAECKAAGLSPAFARTVGIAVDHRRKNKSEEAMALNVARLNAYKSKLILFPRKDGKPKKGQVNDATDAQVKAAKQNLNAAVLALPAKAAAAPEFVKITKEMSGFNAAKKCRELFLEKRDHGKKARKAELDAAKKKAS
jgi:large subunit ribosomal protein L13e